MLSGSIESEAAAGRVESMEEKEEEEAGEDEEEGEEAKEATPWGEDFFFPLVGGAVTWAYVRRGQVGSCIPGWKVEMAG